MEVFQLKESERYWPIPVDVAFHITFCEKNGNIGFLLRMKHKAADKTLEQHFLKESKATCKNSSESEQQKAIRHAT